MFEKIKAAQDAMTKTYFGKREVKEFSEPQVMNEAGEMSTNGQVLVEYAEGLPQFEAVEKEEWEAGKSDAPIEDGKWAEWLVKRSLPLRTQIHKAIEQANPRFADIERMLDWVKEGYNMAFKAAVDAKMGTQDFASEGTLTHIFKAYTEAGEDAFKGRTEVFKDLMQVLEKHGVKVNQILHQGFLTQFQAEAAKLINHSFSLILGGDDEHRRCDDLTDILEAYERTKKDGDKSASVEGAASSDTEATDTRKDAETSVETDGGQGSEAQSA